ncbi:hypothetical protein QBC47DRAFT_363064 [Echria macrotheca]|uniref:C2H2-type domain-containing protein n=1 Tax=Echria macrotheca TaxID=438768 RepID=A0AAJ0B841_9PEZI|nr:hypothetical protein QBC47DRAFT_363064 [Echria macrotheca]
MDPPFLTTAPIPSSLPQTSAPEPLTCREGACASKPETCDRMCDYNKHLKRHDLPYKCRFPGCKYTGTNGFSQLRDQERHEEDAHQAKSSFRCYVAECPGSAKRADNMMRHLRGQHGIKSTKADVIALCKRGG